MVDKGEWEGRSGQKWAEQWRRTDRSFNHLTERLLQRTRDFRFGKVLDIGCGAGELTLAMARGRPETAVTGVDVSQDLIAVAKERGSNLGNIEFITADAAKWQSTAGTAPDLLISRHGVMFFDEPVAAFANLAKQAQPSAGLLFSCFREIAQNPFFTEIIRLHPGAPPPLDQAGPGPFAFADEGLVTSILQSARWDEVIFEKIDFPMIAGAGENPVEDALAYFSQIGPAARAAIELNTAARERFFGRIRDLCERNNHGGIVSLPAAAWIVSARKSA
ncbi:MAG: class I SAM-dependent methyltransferase [Alteraurantiacibacter sp.]